jgi:hypothetical protein
MRRAYVRAHACKTPMKATVLCGRPPLLWWSIKAAAAPLGRAPIPVCLRRCPSAACTAFSARTPEEHSPAAPGARGPPEIEPLVCACLHANLHTISNAMIWHAEFSPYL